MLHATTKEILNRVWVNDEKKLPFPVRLSKCCNNAWFSIKFIEASEPLKGMMWIVQELE